MLINIFKIKAELLCWGVKATSSAKKIYSIQHPTDHKRTGNSGIHFVLDKQLLINVIYGEQFCEMSPYHIEEKDKTFWLFKAQDKICECNVIPPPAWYAKKTKNGTVMEEIFMQEGRDTLITAIWNNCCYFSNDSQCKFCVLGYNKGVELKKVNQIVETAQAALQENAKYYIHLTGGNTFTPDHGIAYYEPYVKALRAINVTVPISLEVAPPEDTAWLEKLVACGASGFSVNIEIWDEQRRKQICPGKSKIKRELYYSAWETGVKLLGKFRISSMLIVGLDTKEHIKEGIKTLAALGVKPTLIPLRPFAKGSLYDLPVPDPVEFMELSLYAGQELAKNGAVYSDFVGCEHCGACTMENDCLKRVQNKGGI